jgi:hypothetical protein
MTNRLQAAIAAASQLSESEQDVIATLILERISTTSTTMPVSEHPSIAASDQITGLFADEPELMEQVMQSIEHDRQYDRQQSLG